MKTAAEDRSPAEKDALVAKIEATVTRIAPKMTSGNYCEAVNRLWDLQDLLSYRASWS